MKILKGPFKGIDISAPDDRVTRPTVDHMKRNILKMIAPPASDACVWDLFAGSGGVGLELLSHGFKQALFIEYRRAALDHLKLNWAQCQLQNPQAGHTKEVRWILMALPQAMAEAQGLGPAWIPHLVFMDPPYGEGWVLKTLKALTLMPSRFQILIEHVMDESPSANILTDMGLQSQSQEVYGPKALTLINKNR